MITKYSILCYTLVSLLYTVKLNPKIYIMCRLASDLELLVVKLSTALHLCCTNINKLSNELNIYFIFTIVLIHF